MARPTRVHIDTSALLHNFHEVKRHAREQGVVAMVKANAYGCGLKTVVSTLAPHVDAFGVACLEEALAIRALGVSSPCILFQGFFSVDELYVLAQHEFQCVIHESTQLQRLLSTPLPNKIKVWLKVDTGMHRLGFLPEEVYGVIDALNNCSWIESPLGLMTHLACADDPSHPLNQEQLLLFDSLRLPHVEFVKSIANSAAILAFPQSHANMVRPGIMLYGVSPFPKQNGRACGLKPVMHFLSAISAIHHYPANAYVGYGATWKTAKPSIIGVVAAGYGDGYPRHIQANTMVWVDGYFAPIVGRVSMDMLTVDLSDCPGIVLGSPVELWGQHVPVELVAASAGTLAYELLCHFSPRARIESR